MTNYEDAIDEMFALFYAAWLANTAVVVGYVPEVRWPGVESNLTPSPSVYWARVSQQTVIEGQSTFRNENSEQRYTTEGLIFVQVFAPRSDSQAMTKLRRLATIGRNSFRGRATQAKVWFRNARINELEPEEKYYRLNVVAEYEYDENS